MNALIVVIFIFVLLGTGMGPEAAALIWAVLAVVEWLADRYAGCLFNRRRLATPAITTA